MTYETARRGCLKFGALYAARLSRKRPPIGLKWHLDEVFIRINGIQHSLWRAMDQHGVTVGILVQPKRDRWAALLFFNKLLHEAGCKPRVIVTDKLRSYGGKGMHPARGKASQSQPFLTYLKPFNAPFRLRHHLTFARVYRQEFKRALFLWHILLLRLLFREQSPDSSPFLRASPADLKCPGSISTP